MTPPTRHRLPPPPIRGRRARTDQPITAEEMPARQESGQCTDRVGRYVTVTRHHAAALLQTAREAAAAELDQDRLRNGSERDEDLFLREYPRRER